MSAYRIPSLWQHIRWHWQQHRLAPWECDVLAGVACALAGAALGYLVGGAL